MDTLAWPLSAQTIGQVPGPSGRQVLVNGHDWPKLAAKTAAQFVAQCDRWPGRQDIVSVSTHELCERGDWDNGLAEATANVLHTQIKYWPNIPLFLGGPVFVCVRSLISRVMTMTVALTIFDWRHMSGQ